MIVARTGESVEKITLARGEWCSFVSANGVEYIVTNARGKLVVTKPLSTRRLSLTAEMRDAFKKISVLA